MGVNRSSRALWSLGFSGQLPWISFPYPKTQLIPALILRLFYRFTKLSRLSFIRCLSHLLEIHSLSEMSLLMESDLFFSHSFKRFLHKVEGMWLSCIPFPQDMLQKVTWPLSSKISTTYTLDHSSL